MSAAERVRPLDWDRLSPEVQAAVDRELDRLGSLRWEREHCRRLAVLLGLAQADATTDPCGAPGGDAR